MLPDLSHQSKQLATSILSSTRERAKEKKGTAFKQGLTKKEGKTEALVNEVIFFDRKNMSNLLKKWPWMDWQGHLPPQKLTKI